MITYVDTSTLVKLLIDDELHRPEAERLWLEADHVVCAEIGYVEARAALAAAQRRGRLDAIGLHTAKDQFESLWDQVSVVAVDTALVRGAGDIAELQGLRGYDAVHLAAAVIARVTVVASADQQLTEAARRHGFAVAQLR
ncbi:MAG: type II toxin-antitoxin system VapC family toxin [Microlunatus sp.]|nr:type II toxin-antitoxin system VapC family toxin [Microlunatus sp.]